MKSLHSKLIDLKDVLEENAQKQMKEAEKHHSSEKWCNYYLGAALGYNAAKEALERLIRTHSWTKEELEK